MTEKKNETGDEMLARFASRVWEAIISGEKNQLRNTLWQIYFEGVVQGAENERRRPMSKRKEAKP